MPKQITRAQFVDAVRTNLLDALQGEKAETDTFHITIERDADRDTKRHIRDVTFRLSRLDPERPGALRTVYRDMCWFLRESGHMQMIVYTMFVSDTYPIAGFPEQLLPEDVKYDVGDDDTVIHSASKLFTQAEYVDALRNEVLTQLGNRLAHINDEKYADLKKFNDSLLANDPSVDMLKLLTLVLNDVTGTDPAQTFWVLYRALTGENIPDSEIPLEFKGPNYQARLS